MSRPQPDESQTKTLPALEEPAEVPDGHIRDFVSGVPVRATPEEVEAVQVFARQLVEDYGYPKNLLRTRPQFHVRSKPSDTRKPYGLDIAVFSEEPHSDDSLYVIVECKKKSRKDGRKQLEDYLTLSNARLGVWFNGSERLFIKKNVREGGGVDFEEIPNIPRHGQTLEDIGQLRRCDLRTPHNLKSDFRAIRNRLAGNAIGATDDKALAGQLINLVFCKIFDEKFADWEGQLDFRARVDEPASTVARRVRGLFKKVKAKYSAVLSKDDAIALDDESIKFVVSQIQGYCLLDADRDVIADAFETFISYALKGESGQFFTPRNVVRLLVELTNPTWEENVIDPACGSGGFLVESLRHMWGQLDNVAEAKHWNARTLDDEKSKVAAKRIHGIEKDDFLAKVTKAYMAIMGDGKGGVFCDDSLELPENWKKQTGRDVALGRFDVVLANPPFGKDIKVFGDDKLAQFELASRWDLDKDSGEYTRSGTRLKEQNPQILFIERCLQLLKPGGRLGIIIPETYFHAPKARHVLRFLTKGNNVKWVVDLPHNTFRPHCNAKCVAIIVQKGRSQQRTISMAVAEEMGHDHQGKPKYRWDTAAKKVNRDEVWDDIAAILDELHGRSQKQYTFDVPASGPANSGIYVPRYYWSSSLSEVRAESKTRKQTLISVQQLIDAGVLTHFDGHGSPASENKGRGAHPYIRVKDIVNWEVYKDPTSMVPDTIFAEMVKDGKTLQPGDVLFVRRGSYRIGSVAMVSPFDLDVILTREILVLRVAAADNPWGIDPYYLLYLLDTAAVAKQIPNKVLIETTLPNIAERWKELLLPVDDDEATRKAISAQVKTVIEKKWEAVAAVKRLREELKGRSADQEQVEADGEAVQD